jgi:hypothetical protein
MVILFGSGIQPSLYPKYPRDTDVPMLLVAKPLDRRMTHFLSFDLLHLPFPLHQVPILPPQVIPVQLLPMDPIIKVEKWRSPRALPLLLPPAPVSSFKDYSCSRLPIWEQQLIQHVCRQESTVSLSEECLSDGIPLCLCTDGEALKHIGSIGWVIATADEVTGLNLTMEGTNGSMVQW